MPAKDAAQSEQQLEIAKKIKHVAEKLQSFTELVKLCPAKSIELEERIVMRPSANAPRSQWSSNVPELYFNQLLEQCKRNAGQFAEIIPWFEIYDCHYENDLRRSKTVVKGKNDQGQMVVQKESTVWVKKKRLLQADLLIPERPLAIRTQLKKELECNPPAKLPPCLLLRYKTRCSFIDSLGIRIDFTRIWQGKSEDEVKQQKTPELQIEIEFPKNKTTSALSSEESAGLLLVRAIELLGVGSPWSICLAGVSIGPRGE